VIPETETRTEPAADQTEAYQTLLARVGRRSPKIPADVLVRHVLRCVPPGEWPVRVEAMDALLRRLESVKRDGLRIGSRPEDGRLLGPYVTKRRTADVRPYSTVLDRIEPIDGRCDCPDFVKNSLGVCKHLLVVLEHLYARPRLLRQALKEQEQEQGPAPAGLRWDPIRPLTGAGDWLERVRFLPPATGGPRGERWARALKWFRPGGDGASVLKRTFPDDPARRLALVEDVRKALPAGAPGDPALRALFDGERARLKRAVDGAPTARRSKRRSRG
jgi:hypothetical protein